MYISIPSFRDDLYSRPLACGHWPFCVILYLYTYCVGSGKWLRCAYARASIS